MGSLRSAVDELAAGDVARLEDRQLEEDIVEIYAQVRRLRAEASRRVAEFDRREAFKAPGFLSATSWLRDTTGVRGGDAAKDVGRARALGSMPVVKRAFEAGELQVPVVDGLVAAARAHPLEFIRDEAVLVDSLVPLAPSDASKALGYWRQALDGGLSTERQFELRRLFVSKTFEGMFRVDGDLDAEGGAIVDTALRVHAETLDKTDTRTSAQKRADALVDICRDFLDHHDHPVKGGDKPHINITVSLEALESRAGQPCEVDESGVISAETARRLACDASISRIITKGESQPLDVGRRTRTISPAQRRALNLRDGGCRFGGCDRAARWCDAHHIKHWIDGGETNLANLILLCRRHHRMVHEGLIEIQLE